MRGKGGAVSAQRYVNKQGGQLKEVVYYLFIIFTVASVEQGRLKARTVSPIFFRSTRMGKG